MAGTEGSATRLEDMTIRLGPLLKALECTVCLEVVKIPFKSCQRGHLVCNKCIQTLLRCPTCQAEFSMENHVSVKNIVEMLPRACRYAGNGCKEVVEPEPGVGNIHDERFCGFRRISCEEYQVMTNRQYLLAHDFKKHALNFARGHSKIYNNADKKVVIPRVPWYIIFKDYTYNFVPHFEYDALFLLKFRELVNNDLVEISFTSFFIGKPVDDVFILVTFIGGNVELKLTLKACRDGETDLDVIKLSHAKVLSYMIFQLNRDCRILNYSYNIFKKLSV